MRDFVGLILAGGMGQRWGGPKAWAALPDGRSFLEACAEVLAAAGAVRTAATLPPGSLDPRLEGVDALPLPAEGLDMFASLRTGLEHLVQREDWQVVEVLPVDHPLVALSTIRALASAPGRAAIPSYRGKHGHPARLDREAATAIVCGELRGPTLRDVLRVVGTVELEVDDPGVVANCNTPAALRAALSAEG